MTTALTTRPAAHVVVADPLATTERHAGALMNFMSKPADAEHRLIPPAELSIVVEELRSIMETPLAADREAEAEIKALVGSYPRGPDNAAVYLVAMAGEASRWPADILRQARLALTRSVKFLPTVAELAEACEAIQGRRRMLLIAAERMQREHERREAARLLDMRQDQQARDHLEALQLQHRAVFGDRAPSANDYGPIMETLRIAGNMRGDFQSVAAIAWAKAYEAGEPWAVLVVAPRALVYARALRAHRTDAFGMDVLTAIAVALANGDEASARSMVERAETGEMVSVERPTADRSTLRLLLAKAFDKAACEQAAEAPAENRSAA